MCVCVCLTVFRVSGAHLCVYVCDGLHISCVKVHGEGIHMQV